MNFLSDQILDQSIVDEFTCAICLDIPLIPQRTSCNHIFCANCLSKWMEHSKCCPMCNRQFTASNDESTRLKIMNARCSCKCGFEGMVKQLIRHNCNKPQFPKKLQSEIQELRQKKIQWNVEFWRSRKMYLTTLEGQRDQQDFMIYMENERRQLKGIACEWAKKELKKMTRKEMEKRYVALKM